MLHAFQTLFEHGAMPPIHLITGVSFRYYGPLACHCSNVDVVLPELMENPCPAQLRTLNHRTGALGPGIFEPPTMDAGLRGSPSGF